MPTIALTDAYISINGNDVSSDGNSVTLPYEAETLDATAFGDDTRVNIGGLKNWSMEIQFHQDFANGDIDSIIFPLVGTTIPIIVRPTTDAVSSSNPQYAGSGLISNYTPFGNSVGELASCSISIVCSGTLTRTTS